MLKRVLILIAVIIFSLCSIIFIRIKAERPNHHKDFNFHISKGETGHVLGYSDRPSCYLISGYLGESKNVIIPETYEKLQVVAVWWNAFQDRKIESIKFSKNIERIYPESFMNNNLEHIVFPNNIKQIGYSAFKNNKLVSVSFPNSLKEIMFESFSGNMLKSIEIPDSVTRILYRAFENNFLENITLPSNLEYIEREAFKNNNLKSINIPSSLKIIEGDVFIENPINEIIINSVLWQPMPQYSFHEKLTGFLPPGRYLLKSDGLWYVENPDKTLIPYRMHQENYIRENTDIIPRLLIRNAYIVEHLIELGADADTYSSQVNTPLSYALRNFSDYPKLTEVLIKHMKRPFTDSEYDLIIGLNRSAAFGTAIYYLNENKTRAKYGWELLDMPDWNYNFDYDELILRDIRRGVLDPFKKINNTMDVFDLAARKGSGRLMRGLLPYLRGSNKTILALRHRENAESEPYGLFIDAINEVNLSAAMALSTIMDKTFTAKDASGNQYSLIFNMYDLNNIKKSSRLIPDNRIYFTATGETWLYSEETVEALKPKEDDWERHSPPQGLRYDYFRGFDNGYFYTQKDKFHIICFTENGVLKRKLMLSFNQETFHGNYYSFWIRPRIYFYQNKIYMHYNDLAFRINPNTSQVLSSFVRGDPQERYDSGFIDIFPHGNGEVVYAYSKYISDR